MGDKDKREQWNPRGRHQRERMETANIGGILVGISLILAVVVNGVRWVWEQVMLLLTG